MDKVYISSNHSDQEVELAISNLPIDKLRVCLFGLARGWGFDDAMNISIFIGTEIKPHWDIENIMKDEG